MDIKVIEFKTEYPASGDAMDWVLIAPRGEAMESVQTWHRVKDLKPKGTEGGDIALVREMKWSAVGPLYDAWKQGNELPDEGTPLGAWSGVSADQAAHLKRMGITTVEHVRDMSESAVVKLPFPDARRLPKLAADFLSSRSAAEKDRELSDMRERMEAMEAMLLEQKEPEKRGPGRPKKQEPEAA